jgi:hypothetical protein
MEAIPKESGNGGAIVRPVGEVVAEPFADFGPGAGEGTARDDDGAAGGAASKHGGT